MQKARKIGRFLYTTKKNTFYGYEAYWRKSCMKVYFDVTELKMDGMIVYVLLLLMSACHTVAILNTNQFVTLHQNITELILQSTRLTRNNQKHRLCL